MTNFDELPREQGIYRIETASGTVHILNIAGRTTWERRPGPGAETERYDHSPRTLSQLGPGWEVGRQAGVPRRRRRKLPRRRHHPFDSDHRLHHGRARGVREDASGVRLELLQALVDRLPNLAWERIPESDQGIEPVAKMMISSLPTAFIDDPPMGACYTARGLAAWRGMTRQAVHQQRRAGRILGFTHGREVVYPAFQFSDIGRTLPVVRDLFAQFLTLLTDAAEVAASAWLDTINRRSGRGPRQLLGTSPATTVGERVVPSLTQVAVIRRALLHQRPQPSEVGK